MGSPAVSFVVLSNKVKAARVGLGRQCTPTQCVRDDFLWETSLNADLHWFHGGSAQWMSTGNAEEPQIRVKIKEPCSKPNKRRLAFSSLFLLC
jgi:hypothetical protein